MTMDDKIIHIKAEMTYRVSDPSQFAFAFEDATSVLQLILDNGVTFAASRADLSTILGNPTQFAENVKSRGRGKPGPGEKRAEREEPHR